MHPSHSECFAEYVFPDFNGSGVTLVVQELTGTVGHSPSEKRFFHLMFQSEHDDPADPRPLRLINAISRDYLGKLYAPLDAALKSVDDNLKLPRLNPDNQEWVEMLQRNMTASLLYYAEKLNRSMGDDDGSDEDEPAGGVEAPAAAPCSPTCCPHILVMDAAQPETLLFADISVALHCAHAHHG